MTRRALLATVLISAVTASFVSCDASPEAATPTEGASSEPSPPASTIGSADGAVDNATGGEGGPPYPGLPASCQAMTNHGDGGCIDRWSSGGPAWELAEDVEDAIAALDVLNTALFDADGSVPEAKRPAFLKALQSLLDAKGICAVWDGTELYVRKPSRDYDETFRLFQSNGQPRVVGHYQCEPSSTIPGAPLPIPFPPQGCAATLIPPGTAETSGCQTVGAMGSATEFFADVETAVLDVIAVEQSKASSLVFDTGHTNLVFQSGWEDKAFRIKDKVFFLNAVAQRLSSKGYCYSHGGYDTLLLKKNMARSEDFDLVQAVDCGGALPECKPSTPKGDYVRYPGKGVYCRLAEF